MRDWHRSRSRYGQTRNAIGGEGRTDSAWCVKKQRQTKNNGFSVRRTSRNVVTRQGYGTFPTEGFGPQTFVQTLEVPTLIGTGDKAVS